MAEKQVEKAEKYQEKLERAGRCNKKKRPSKGKKPSKE